MKTKLALALALLMVVSSLAFVSCQNQGGEQVENGEGTVQEEVTDTTAPTTEEVAPTDVAPTAETTLPAETAAPTTEEAAQ